MFSQAASQLGLAESLSSGQHVPSGVSSAVLASLPLGRASAAFLPLYCCLECRDDGRAQVLRQWIIKREKKYLKRKNLGLCIL